jgi:hypothetical protein
MNQIKNSSQFYTSLLFHKFAIIAKQHGLRIAYSQANDLKQLVKTHNDVLDKLSYCGMVYKISWNDCDATYISQTKKKLGTSRTQNGYQKEYLSLYGYRSEGKHDFD